MVLVVAGLLAPLAPCAAAQKNVSVAEQYLFHAANAERARRGLPALRWDDGLYRAARLHAIEMARRESISHQYPGEPDVGGRARQQGARFSVVAENVAEAPTAVDVHDAWMHSPEHRANLLDGQVDSVGISVVRRSGQLYAVEDFDRSVANLSFASQEQAVMDQLSQWGDLAVLPPNDDARRTCEMDTGYAGSRRPLFVMRYTTGDIEDLPDVLKQKIASGRYREAVVGACPATGTESFSAFNIAVLLYR
jgi:hypothetical protein